MREKTLRRKYQRLTTLVTLLLLLLFCAFVFVYERYALTQAQARIDDHSKIIANALWNFDYNAATEYLKLAAISQNYESLRVTDHSGEIFQQLTTPRTDPIEHFLMKTHLIPRVKLLSQVEKRGNVIGWVEAVWIPRTIFVHAYVFFALLLLIVIIHLYARILLEKRFLEDRVRQRTTELSRSNRSLREEIAERKRAEEKLRSSEAKLRMMTENISDVLWTTDLELNYTYISPAAMRLQGWSAEELETLTIEKSLAPASFQIAAETLARDLEIGQKTGNFNRTATLELELQKKDGTTVWTEVTATFLVGEDNKPVGLLGVTRDISERLKAQLEKEELQKQLDRSKKMEALGLLAGGVAHDLNNVLSGIVSYPDLLLMDLPADSPLKSPIQTIKDSGQKAATIVQDLLTLARRGVMAEDIINLNELIQEHLASPEHKKLLSYHPQIVVETHLEGDLPNIKGSPVHLKKTVMNLISNAAEAHPKDNRITISTQSRYLDKAVRGYHTVTEGEYVVITIEDRGDGIAAADLQRIFEPFYTKKVMGRSGTGLGMAVVWGTVQDHKGYIDIRSAQGKGTTIEVYFPLTREEKPSQSKQTRLEDIRGAQETVLVVDDMPEQREIAQNILTALNYKVYSVSSGEEAVDFLSGTPVDLVVLDMIMDPGIDGLETYKRIRDIRPDQKAVIASGFAETDRVKKAQSLGAGAYIRKPYTMEKIGVVLQKTLAHS